MDLVAVLAAAVGWVICHVRLLVGALRRPASCWAGRAPTPYRRPPSRGGAVAADSARCCGAPPSTSHAARGGMSLGGGRTRCLPARRMRDWRTRRTVRMLRRSIRLGCGRCTIQQFKQDGEDEGSRCMSTPKPSRRVFGSSRLALRALPEGYRGLQVTAIELPQAMPNARPANAVCPARLDHRCRGAAAHGTLLRVGVRDIRRPRAQDPS